MITVGWAETGERDPGDMIDHVPKYAYYERSMHTRESMHNRAQRHAVGAARLRETKSFERTGKCKSRTTQFENELKFGKLVLGGKIVRFGKPCGPGAKSDADPAGGS